eukprot:260744-Rhodomonas_salina.3
MERRIASMEQWLENPELLEADKDAEYAAVIEINLNESVSHSAADAADAFAAAALLSLDSTYRALCSRVLTCGGMLQHQRADPVRAQRPR